MVDEEEFKIKGAAKASSSPAGTATDHHHDDQSDQAADETSEAAEEAEEGELPGGTQALSSEDSFVKYRWFKCEADPATYGPDQFYFIHTDTQVSKWIEPEEPYWIYDAATGLADPIGLQFPLRTKPSGESVESSKDEEGSSKAVDETYNGYNPKIHGDYDPNADYAQYHKQKRAEEAVAADSYGFGGTAAPGGVGYGSTMTLNRFTGNAQAADLGPDRHSDAAKSGRQMNAFFNVDAAANVHEGRSLKEERQAQKLSKEQVKAFNAAKKEKKKKKQLAFYKS